MSSFFLGFNGSDLPEDWKPRQNDILEWMTPTQVGTLNRELQHVFSSIQHASDLAKAIAGLPVRMQQEWKQNLDYYIQGSFYTKRLDGTSDALIQANVPFTFIPGPKTTSQRTLADVETDVLSSAIFHFPNAPHVGQTKTFRDDLITAVVAIGRVKTGLQYTRKIKGLQKEYRAAADALQSTLDSCEACDEILMEWLMRMENMLSPEVRRML